MGCDIMHFYNIRSWDKLKANYGLHQCHTDILKTSHCHVSLFKLNIKLNLVIYIANVWNEKEANNACERRDFEDDEVKSHINVRLSSAQPFNSKAIQVHIY